GPRVLRTVRQAHANLVANQYLGGAVAIFAFGSARGSCAEADFTKPLSLSFRLFGNVLADELTVAVLTFLVPFVIPLPIMALGIFAGSIQALIFATLASAYIAEAIE
ncbi:unnamed protein product, partial [Prorocentrum cordatum]